MWWLAFLLTLSGYHCQKPILPDLPSPRIVIVGPTGSGKSSLANAFLGCDPRAKDCMFKVCTNLDSCTKETTYGTGPWLGTGKNFTVVDTPGLGDSDNQDEEHIEEMMDVLTNRVDHVDTLVLLFNGENTRFTAGLQKMLKTMTLMFGQDWWNFVVVGVSFWPYDQASIDKRRCDPDYPDYCKDEAWFEEQINGQMKNKTSAKNDFSFVFTDSWSQTPGPPGYNTDDSLQQEWWQKETGKLWEISTTREEVYTFQTIDDILQENARQRAEIARLNDIISDNITELMSRMDTNEADMDALKDTVCDVKELVDHQGGYISDLQSHLTIAKVVIKTNTDNISNNTLNIATNTDSISTNTDSISANTDRISTNTDNISTNTDNISTNTDSISTNTDNIATNTNAIHHPPTVAVCGYRDKKTDTGIITYDHLYTNHITDSSTLSTTTGTYTTVTTGVYSITWSGSVFMGSNKGASMSLYRNGEWVGETWYNSDSNGGAFDQGSHTRDQGSRTILQCLERGDKVDLRVDDNSGAYISTLLFCVNLVQASTCSG